MNIIDIAILIAFALFVLHGYYKGFLISVLGTACFFVSWVFAILLSPMVARKIVAYETLSDAMLYYTEGAEKLASIEDARLSVAALTPEDINRVVDTAELNPPIDELIRSNLSGQAFKDAGITTVGDYFNQTIVNFAINVVAFLIIFLIVRLILSFVIGGADALLLIPRLTHFDGLMGAGLGLVNGFFMLFLVFTVTPIVLTVLPFPEIRSFIDESFFGSFFSGANFLLSLIKGTI